MVDVITAIGTAMVVYFGARRALGGYITPGALIVFVSYLRDLYRPVGGFSELMIDLAALWSAERGSQNYSRQKSAL